MMIFVFLVLWYIRSKLISLIIFFLIVQAFVLKYLLFFPDELGKFAPNMPQNLGSGRLTKSQYVASSNFNSLTEDAKAR